MHFHYCSTCPGVPNAINDMKTLEQLITKSTQVILFGNLLPLLANCSQVAKGAPRLPPPPPRLATWRPQRRQWHWKGIGKRERGGGNETEF